MRAQSTAVGLALAAAMFTAAGMLSANAGAYPPYMDAWVARYPTSTIPQQMQALTGSACNMCHHPPLGTIGNCYREALRQLMSEDYPVEVAIDMLDSMDSDADGVLNGVEILLPRADHPGHIGYNPGLVGLTGTDPCSDTPNVGISTRRETPCMADWNRDAAVNSADISAYITSWLDSVQTGGLGADFNADGQVNSSDISAFITAWLGALGGGC